MVATTAGKAGVFVCPMYVDPVAQSDSGIHVEEEDGALLSLPRSTELVSFFKIKTRTQF